MANDVLERSPEALSKKIEGLGAPVRLEALIACAPTTSSTKATPVRLAGFSMRLSAGRWNRRTKNKPKASRSHNRYGDLNHTLSIWTRAALLRAAL